MTKRKALKIIVGVTIIMFTITAVTVVVIAKLNRFHTLAKEHHTLPSRTTTQPMSLKDRRSKLMSKCQRENNLNLDTITKLNQEIIDEEDEGTKKYFLCIFQGMGILDDEGNLTLDPTAIRQWLPGTTNEMLVVISEKCLNSEGKTPEDFAVVVMKCFLNIGNK